MPDIRPTPNDIIEITLYQTNKEPIGIFARITTKDQSGKYQVELAGIPTLRGLINIDEYEWSPESSKWFRKKELAGRGVSVPKLTSLKGKNDETLGVQMDNRGNRDGEVARADS